jgi:hypothetical protein
MERDFQGDPAGAEEQRGPWHPAGVSPGGWRRPNMVKNVKKAGVSQGDIFETEKR